MRKIAAIILTLMLMPVLVEAISLNQNSVPALSLHGINDYIRSLTNFTGYDIRNASLTNWLCTSLNCSFYIYLDNDNISSKSGTFTINNIINASVWVNRSDGWQNLSSLDNIGLGTWNYSQSGNRLTVGYSLAGGDGYEHGVRNANLNGSYWLDENGRSLDSGLLLNLHFEEGSGFSYTNDSSGYNNHGTLFNMNTTGNSTSGWTTDCKFGKCLRFDGVDDEVRTANTIHFDTSSNSYTFTAWVKLQPDTSTVQFIVGNFPEIGLDVSSDVTAIGAWKSGRQGTWVSVGSFANAWHHIAAVIHPGSSPPPRADIYFDGVFVGNSITDALGEYTDDTVVSIGYDSDWSAYSTASKGLIDEVRIYNRALSAEEIKQLYEQSRLKFSNDFVTVKMSEDLINITNSTGGSLFSEFLPSYTLDGVPLRTIYRANDSQVYFYDWGAQKWKIWQKNTGNSTHGMPDWNDPRNRHAFKWRQEFKRDYYPDINFTYLITSSDPFVRTFVDISQKHGELSSTEANNPDLVGYWKLNSVNSTNYTLDYSGHGNDGQLGGGSSSQAPQLVSGKIGNALQFDGTDDYVSLGTSDDFNLNTEFSIEAWVKPDVFTSWMSWAARDYDGSHSQWRATMGWSGNQWGITWFDGSWHDLWGGSIDIGAWNHLVIVVNGNDFKFYKNGALDWSTTSTNTISSLSGKETRIGYQWDNNLYFDGTIDEVRIYNRSLSADEIRENFYRGAGAHNISIPIKLEQNKSMLDDGLVFYAPMEEGSGSTKIYDYSGNRNNGNLLPSGSGPVWTTGKFGSALSFDGTDDYINISSPSGLSTGSGADWTLEAWIKPIDHVSSIQHIVSYGDATDTHNPFIGLYPGDKFIVSSWGVANDVVSNLLFSIGEWYHVVGVGKGSELILYVNGKVVAGPTSVVNNPSAERLHIGADTRSTINEFFNGLIDEVRIYNRALSAEEVWQLYQIGQTKIKAGNYYYKNSTSDNILWTAQNFRNSYRGSFANPKPSYFNITEDNTNKKLIYSYDFNGTLNNNFLFTLGTTDYQNTSLDITNFAENRTLGFSNETLERVVNSTLTYYDLEDKSLVGWWKFNEEDGSIASDSSGWNNTGTLFNMNTTGNSTSGWTSGKFGNGLQFDGIDDYVSVSPNLVGLSDNSSSTISMWVKTKPVFNSYNTNTIWNFGGGSYRNLLEINYNTNETTFYFWNGASNAVYSGVPSHNLWHHIVATDNGETSKLYIDGELKAIGNTTGAIRDYSSKVLYIGYEADGTDRYFNGTIDNVKIYSRALTPEEIKAEYEAEKDDYPNWAKTEITGGAQHTVPVSFKYDGGAVGIWKFDEGSGSIATDSSGNGNNGELKNGPAWTTGKFGNALSFDGTDDYMNAGNDASLDITNAITIEAWIKPESFNAVANGIIYKRAAGADDSYFLEIVSSGTGIKWGYGTGASWVDPVKSYTFSAGKWYHLVGVRTSNYLLKWYINGKEIGSYQASGTPSSNSANVSIAADSGLNYPFNGLIDELRIYNRALSGSEIKEHYEREVSKYYDDFNVGVSKIYSIENSTTNFSAPIDSSTVLALKFEEGSGFSYTNDSSGYNNHGTLVNMNTTGSSTSGWTTDCKFGKCLRFDGVDDYVDAGAGINIASKSFSLVAWAKRDSIDTVDYIFGQGTTSTNQGLHFGFRTLNLIRFGFYFNDLDTPNAYTDTDWHLWVGTYDATTNERKIYRDGVLVASDTASADYQGTGTLYIGRSPWGDYFDGTIDEVRIYNRALSAEEIREIYEGGAKRHSPSGNIYKVVNLNDFASVQRTVAYNLSDIDRADMQDYDQRLLKITGASKQVVLNVSRADKSEQNNIDMKLISAGGSDIAMDNNFSAGVYGGLVGYWKLNSVNSTNYTLDYSGHGNDGQLGGGSSSRAPQLVSGKVGNALQFDGIDDYVQVSDLPSLNITDAITIAAWVKPISKMSSDGWEGIVHRYTGYGGYLLTFPYTNATSVEWILRYNTTIAKSISTPEELPLNKFSFVLATFKRPDMKLYLNGELVASGVFDYTLGDAGIGPRIGYYNRYFNGTIDEVKIYNRALSPEEIRQEYEAGRARLFGYINPENYDLEMNITNVSIKIYNINLTNMTKIDANITFDNNTISTAFPFGNVTKRMIYNTTQNLGTHYTINITASNALRWRKCLNPPCTDWEFLDPSAKYGNVTMFNLSYSQLEIIGGLWQVFNTTINFIAHIGSLFADDSIQGDNSYGCMQDGGAWVGLTGESPIRFGYGNMTEDYYMNVSMTSADKAYIAAGKGSCANFNRYIGDVQQKKFLEPLKAFSYAATNLVQLVLKFDKTDIINDAHWTKGTFKLSVKNEGYDSAENKQKLRVKVVK